MGHGLSKEQGLLPFAYARIDPLEEQQQQHLSSNNGTSDPTTTSSHNHNGVDHPRRDNSIITQSSNISFSGYSSSRNAVSPEQLTSNIEDAGEEYDDEDVDDEDQEWEYDAFGRPRSIKRPKRRVINFGQLTSLTTIGLCSQGLIKVSPNIGLLYATTTLQLCCNELTSIPPEIGHMKNLTTLSVAKNRLTSLPDTIGYLTKLVELKASENQLKTIPATIGTLKKLTTLSLEHNQITELPQEIGSLKTLISLDLSHNPITVLPAELGRLKFLRKLRLEECSLISEFEVETTYTPPSLKELAARVIVRQQLPILKDTQDDLKAYLASAHACSFCGGPYFSSFTRRNKMMEKNDAKVPLEYRLCIPHWNTEQERVSLLFCPLPETAPSPIPSTTTSPVSSPPGSPASIRGKRKTSLSMSSLLGGGNGDKSTGTSSGVGSSAAAGNATSSYIGSSSASSTLPLSALTKSPSLPSLPMGTDPGGLKKALFKKSGLRMSRSTTSFTF
ncbi:Leucine-rich repeat-containing protein 63 [Quaeritorhiza haematococci]|nr:Leucine-rich repeat-containing protein 63 [Quaeritorhiza haematococci]